MLPWTLLVLIFCFIIRKKIWLYNELINKLKKMIINSLKEEPQKSKPKEEIKQFKKNELFLGFVNKQTIIYKKDKDKIFVFDQLEDKDINVILIHIVDKDLWFKIYFNKKDGKINATYHIEIDNVIKVINHTADIKLAHYLEEILKKEKSE